MDKTEELYDLVLSLQAEISALKSLMFEVNPGLAAEHQKLADEIRGTLLRARREQNKSQT